MALNVVAREGSVPVRQSMRRKHLTNQAAPYVFYTTVEIIDDTRQRVCVWYLSGMH